MSIVNELLAAVDGSGQTDGKKTTARGDARPALTVDQHDAEKIAFGNRRGKRVESSELVVEIPKPHTEVRRGGLLSGAVVRRLQGADLTGQKPLAVGVEVDAKNTDAGLKHFPWP
eukprot:762947-Hanusia_phi.AAC.6